MQILLSFNGKNNEEVKGSDYTTYPWITVKRVTTDTFH